MTSPSETAGVAEATEAAGGYGVISGRCRPGRGRRPRCGRRGRRHGGPCRRRVRARRPVLARCWVRPGITGVDPGVPRAGRATPRPSPIRRAAAPPARRTRRRGVRRPPRARRAIELERLQPHVRCRPRAPLLARPGMGWCQGRVCGYATARLTARSAGARSPPTTCKPSPSARWPYRYRWGPSPP